MRTAEEISFILNELLPQIDSAKKRNHLVKTRWRTGRCCYSNTRGQCKHDATDFNVFCAKHTPKKLEGCISKYNVNVVKPLSKNKVNVVKTSARDEGSYDVTDEKFLINALNEVLGFDRIPGKAVYNPARIAELFTAKLVSEKPELEHDATLEFFGKIVEDQPQFVERMFQIKLRNYQKPFFKAICKLPFEKKPTTLSGLFTRQTGKNETVGVAIATLMCIFDGIQIGIFAPTEKQAKSIGLERVRMRLSSNSVISEMIVRDKDDFIMLSNGSSCRAFTANKTSQIEGFTLHIAFMDESQDIDSHIVSHDITPMLAGVSGSSVKFGTTGRKNHFYKTCKRNALKKNKHFEYHWRDVAKELPSYKNFVEALLEELGGLESEEFRSQFCNEWLSDGTAFTDIVKLKKLLDNDFIPETEPIEGAVYTAGLDLAKQRDRTVLTLLRVQSIGSINFYYVVRWWDWFGDNYTNQLDEIVEICNEWEVGIIAVDATKEDSFSDFMEQEGLAVEKYRMTSQVKSDMYKSYLYAIQRARIVVPMIGKDQSVHRRRWMDETEALEKEWITGSIMKVNHPDGENEHDDYPDSMAMAIHVSKQIVAGEVLEQLDKHNAEVYDIQTSIKREFVEMFENERTGEIEIIREDWNNIWVSQRTKN